MSAPMNVLLATSRRGRVGTLKLLLVICLLLGWSLGWMAAYARLAGDVSAVIRQLREENARLRDENAWLRAAGLAPKPYSTGVEWPTVISGGISEDISPPENYRKENSR